MNIFEEERGKLKEMCNSEDGEETISEKESMDLHNAHKDESLERNLACEEVISEKVEETLKMLEKHIEGKTRLGYFGKFPSFFYNKEELPFIRDIFINFNQAVFDVAEKPNVTILGHSNLLHILRNGPYQMIRLAERAADRTEKPQDETKFSSAENIAKISKNKKIWDQFLYYLAFISRKDKTGVLEEELSSEAGYLDKFRNLYQEREIEAHDHTKILKREIATHSPSRISHFNFLTRLEFGRSREALRGIQSSDSITKPITSREEFEAAFNKLEEKELLDKEMVFKRFFN